MLIRHWRELPERPVLGVGECQLWLAWLDEEAPDSFAGFLSEDERIRAGRLRSSRSTDQFTVGRGILRSLLGRYLLHTPEELVFTFGPHGKPALADNLQKRLSFNVSHAGGLAVFAVANGFEVGVDIEEIHAISDLVATASIFLSPDELAEFKAMPTAWKLDHFFTLWTCKEAILKALGSGFTGPVQNLLTLFCQSGLKGERLTLLDPAEGFKGALACL